MPKKPFTPEEVRAQREAIMNIAAKAMSQFGFHHLSMRNLAKQMDMTASNIYNYFPNKEALFLSTRKRGFELFFSRLHEQAYQAETPHDALLNFATDLALFAKDKAGYYQLMFQPPLLNLNNDNAPELFDLKEQVNQLANEWQQHFMSLALDALPHLQQASEKAQKRSALFLLANVHGLVDLYQHKSLDILLNEVDLIPEEVMRLSIDMSLQEVSKLSAKELA